MSRPRYVLSSLYERIFAALAALLARQDVALNKVAKNLLHLPVGRMSLCRGC